MQYDTAGNLNTLQELVQRHGSTEFAQWFASIDWKQATDEKVTDFQLRKKRRDALLIQALSLKPGKQHWKSCSDLAAEIRRFQTLVWPSVRFHAEPPSNFSELESLLFQILKLEITVLTTAQGIINATQIYSV